jgi:hypothetical protein
MTKKVTLLFAILAYGFVLHSQSSIFVEITNDTQDYDYTCTCETYQDVSPIGGSLTISVPASTSGSNTVTELIEFEQADICLNKITCQSGEDAPGTINAKCGDGWPMTVDIGPQIPPSSWYQFIYVDFVPASNDPIESHSFLIEE